MAQAPQPRRPGAPKAPVRPAAKKPGAPAPRAKPAPKDEGPAYDSENAKTVMDEPVVTDEDIVSAEAEDDDLALQANAQSDAESSEVSAGKKFRPVRRPEDLEGRPTTITDTTPYLVIGGGVLALIVLGSIVYMFMGPAPITPKKPPATAKTPDPAPPQQPSPSVPAQPKPPAKTDAVGTSTKTADPAQPVKPPDTPVAGDSNRACFNAAFYFLVFATDEGQEWSPAQLTARFRTDVSRKGVTDTDVSEYAAKVEALLNTGLNHPMKPQERMIFGGDSTHQSREVQIEDAVRKHYELMDQIKILTVKLRRKYGNLPPPPKKEAPPEEKTVENKVEAGP